MTPQVPRPTYRGLPSYRIKINREREREKMKNTKITVTVKFEAEFDGNVPVDSIDIGDIIRDADAIKDIKVKAKTVK